MPATRYSQKYIRRTPSDIVEAVRHFCQYHDTFHRYLQQGGKIESALDRGAFRRPQDLLPPEALRLLGEGQRSNSYAYGPEAGDPKLRDKIAEVENRHHGTNYTQKNIAIMPGAWAGLEFALEEILNLEGGRIDSGKVIVIGPTLYQMFHRPIRFLGVETIAYDFVIPETEHIPTSMEDLEDIFREKPKAIVISNPNNPDGRYFPMPLLHELVERAAREKVFILLDEIQNSLPRDGVGLCYGPWIQAPHVLRMDSPSKRYALAEHRVGWVIADEKLLGLTRMDGIVGRMSGMMGNAPRAANTLLLYLMEKELEKFSSSIDFLQAQWDELRKKEQYILDRLRTVPKIKRVLMPDACINVTIELNRPETDMVFAERLMHAGTLLMPSSGYGYDPEMCTFRITFAERDEKLKHSMDVLTSVLAE